MFGKKRYLAIVFTCALAAGACSEASKEPVNETKSENSAAKVTEQSNSASTVNVVQYQCENGNSLQAEYMSSDLEHSAKITYDGNTFNMYSTKSASGAKYATEQGLTPNDGLIWWSQRDEGMLMTMILDHTAEAEDYPIITNCVKKS